MRKISIVVLISEGTNPNIEMNLKKKHTQLKHVQPFTNFKMEIFYQQTKNAMPGWCSIL